MIKPGLYPDMLNKEYHGAKEAVSSSDLKIIHTKTPAHYIGDLKKEETDAMKQGTWFHTATLQPEKVEEHICIVDLNLRKKDEREEYADILETEKRTVVREGWREDIDAMADAIHKGTSPEAEYAKRIIDNSFIERSIFVVDEGVQVGTQSYPGTGALCKVRLDCDWPEKRTLFDLKSAKDADFDKFKKAIGNNLYHLSAAYYLDMRNIYEGKNLYDTFVWVAVEKETFQVALWGVKIDSETIQAGRRFYRKALEYYAACKEINEWPGFSGSTKKASEGGGVIKEIEAPIWAL